MVIRRQDYSADNRMTKEYGAVGGIKIGRGN
jgi:hypothetical protein